MVNTSQPASGMRDLAASTVESLFIGVVDKAGEPYLGHLYRVAAEAEAIASEFGVDRDDAYVVGLLHDLLEDTDFGEDKLARLFPAHVCEAVRLLTKRKGEPNSIYYERVVNNAIARAVKTADIADNSDPDRLCRLDEQTSQRLAKKYRIAAAAMAAGPTQEFS